MNSRQRILTALKCQAPDRVPISTYELAGYNTQAVENNDPSYFELMQAIREKTDCLAMWNPDSNERFLGTAYPAEMAAQTWREEDRTVTHTTLQTPQGPLTQTIKRLDNLNTPWQTEHWCKTVEDVDRALSLPYVPVTYDASDYARICREVGEHGILMASLGDPLLMAAELMEFGEFTIWAATESAHFERTVRVLHERCMENLRRMLAVNVVELYRICGPEYATPPYLPPALFERFVVPYVAEMVDLIHSHGAQVRLHCHGKIGRVLDMILATGADSIDPCEPPPDGDITLAEVKRRCAGRMCVFGNLELKLLEHGSEAEVAAYVKGCMDAAKAGGGYVIMPTAAPINSPLALQTQRNYVRFIDAALEYGQY
jgi:uroporphyrinogen-III decarboxylase